MDLPSPKALLSHAAKAFRVTWSKPRKLNWPRVTRKTPLRGLGKKMDENTKRLSPDSASQRTSQ